MEFSTPQNAINYVQLIPWSQLSHTVLGAVMLQGAEMLHLHVLPSVEVFQDILDDLLLRPCRRGVCMEIGRL